MKLERKWTSQSLARQCYFWVGVMAQNEENGRHMYSFIFLYVVQYTSLDLQHFVYWNKWGAKYKEATGNLMGLQKGKCNKNLENHFLLLLLLGCLFTSIAFYFLLALPFSF